MQQLEDNDKYHRVVDDDSLLAPLSQTNYKISSESKHNQTLVDGSQMQMVEDESANSDDDLLNDYSMCFDCSPFEAEENLRLV